MNNFLIYEQKYKIKDIRRRNRKKKKKENYKTQEEIGKPVKKIKTVQGFGASRVRCVDILTQRAAHRVFLGE